MLLFASLKKINKGFLDEEEIKQRMGEKFDKNKFNTKDLDGDGRISFQGIIKFWLRIFCYKRNSQKESQIKLNKRI